MPAETLFDTVLKDFKNKKWKERWTAPVTRRQDTRDLLMEVFGMTVDDPPKFYRVWKWINPDEKLTPLILESYLCNLLMTLDSFVDPRCSCTPGPHGEVGEHCEFHKKIMGH